jgi:superfamily I DNA/RNA helicase
VPGGNIFRGRWQRRSFPPRPEPEKAGLTRTSWLGRLVADLAFALGVIAGATVVDLEGDDETVAGYRSTFRGPTPVTRGIREVAEEMRFVAEIVKTWLGNGVAPPAIGVLARRTQEQDRARFALQNAGIAVELLQRDGAGNPDAVKIASRHRAKGTEFSRVVVIGAEAGVVPLDWMVETRPEAGQATVLGRERSLFNVACSRARDELVVT